MKGAVLMVPAIPRTHFPNETGSHQNISPMLLSFHFLNISSHLRREALNLSSGVLWRERSAKSPRIPICCSIATNMSWLFAKNIVVSLPRFRSLALFANSSARKYTSFRSSPLLLYSLRPSLHPPYTFMCLVEAK